MKRIFKLPKVALVTALLFLVVPAVAVAAHRVLTQVTSRDGVKATLTYKKGPSYRYDDLHLRILKSGTTVYDKAIDTHRCGSGCTIYGRPMFVRRLEKQRRADVVLRLSPVCMACSVYQVFSPNAVSNTYTMRQRSFGSYGAKLSQIGAGGRWEFVSGDNAFYCKFADCADAGLPIQIFEFTEGRFKNVTLLHPALIRKDASDWWRRYEHFRGAAWNPYDRNGPIAAWAADEYHLGHKVRADRTLKAQVAAKKLPKGSAKRIETFLKHHGY